MRPWLHKNRVFVAIFLACLIASVLIAWLTLRSPWAHDPGIGDAVIFDETEVSITRVQLGGKLPCVAQGRQQGNPGLAIFLRAHNKSKTRILEYRRWESHLSDGPFLTDEHGNNYGGTRSLDAFTVRGTSTLSRFRPGDSDTDVLIFDAPLPTSQVAYLHLPTPESKGYVTFKLPRSVWQQGSDPQLSAAIRSPDGRLQVGRTYRIDLAGKDWPVAASYRDLDDLTRLLIVEGDEVGRRMVASGRAFQVASGTKVELTDLDDRHPSDGTTYLAAEVRLLDGPHKGKAVFVWAERIH
jgi:hypothetical protein